MSWFLTCDTLHGNRKARRAGAEAMGLWAICGSLAASSSSRGDGTLDDDDVEDRARFLKIKDWKEAKRRLIECGDVLEDGAKGPGFWEPTVTGIRFHDWEDYRPGADPGAIKREKDRARAVTYRERKKRDASRDGQRDESRTRPPDKTHASVNVTRDESATVRDSSSRDRAAAGPRDPVRSDPILSKPGDPPTPTDEPTIGDLHREYIGALCVATAATWPGLPDSPKFDTERECLRNLWREASDDGCSLPDFASQLATWMREWVDSMPTRRGDWWYTPTRFVRWRNARDGLVASGGDQVGSAVESRWTDPTPEELAEAGAR